MPAIQNEGPSDQSNEQRSSKRSAFKRRLMGGSPRGSAAQPSGPYAPDIELSKLGVMVKRKRMQDTWAIWFPHRRAIVVASGLTRVQERCVLAHELEHVLADDGECIPHDSLREHITVRQERIADIRAARKLIALSDLARVLPWATSYEEAAAELDVTERMLRVRLMDLEKDSWLATSKTAG
ncbi:ImmA/IrrE family metallo-endopeptidase [Streptomyces indicus]|uniref:IrrE N-terminal-like domain-containing protein n=1 Tax=Streptomyces indicus TaxID=417292 RepID=A0A1G8WA14_9ACTN|nr:ImmA/IrrE family metallo-endopeptidase [Streptomyces indicus]SDJ74897.1 protein of unknown function [Streptomyces indicus]